jgi:hypothetical protein
MKKLVAVMVLGALTQAACSTTGGTATATTGTAGNQVNPATLASFQTGVTTIDQVEATLGKPVKSVRADSGDDVILYARIRVENVGDSTPETGSALPRRHRVQYSTLLSFDPQGRFITSWTRTDDLGDASPTALGKFNAGDILTSASGMP